MSAPAICVCICTFRRPILLRRLLEALAAQETHDEFTFSVVVADNDALLSARPVVEIFAREVRFPVIYSAEPRQNIALARNRAIAHATGDYLAWIDDDEFPVPDWLHRMFTTCRQTGAAGVLGPVRPHFDAAPPRWVIAGGFCERPEHSTGTVMPGSRCRTGNVLFRHDMLRGIGQPFRAEFGAGGEDVDFFQRMNQLGHTFVWCNEAVAYEVVPPSRLKRSYMLKRALLRGHSNHQLRSLPGLLKSFVALPAYSVVLPGTLLFGHHVFMRYGIRLCDHLGRVLAAFGLSPVRQRPL